MLSKIRTAQEEMGEEFAFSDQVVYCIEIVRVVSFFHKTVVPSFTACQRDVIVLVVTRENVAWCLCQVQLVQEQLEVTAFLEGEDVRGDSKPKASNASGVQEMDCA